MRDYSLFDGRTKEHVPDFYGCTIPIGSGALLSFKVISVDEQLEEMADTQRKLTLYSFGDCLSFKWSTLEGLQYIVKMVVYDMKLLG